jgi:hypothetical protein
MRAIKAVPMRNELVVQFTRSKGIRYIYEVWISKPGHSGKEPGRAESRQSVGTP